MVKYLHSGWGMGWFIGIGRADLGGGDEFADEFRVEKRACCFEFRNFASKTLSICYMNGKEKENKHESALHVNDGVEKPPSVSNSAVARFLKNRRKNLTVDDYVDGVVNGDRVVLSKAITLVESSLPEHYETAQKIIERCLPFSGKSVRVGITGVPGVGKSTFIEAFGKYLTGRGHQLAILAIDPSSQRTKGSILGDKTRMEELSVDPKAFIRPSPSAGSLGGVARKTRESVLLCEAAGFDTIFIETVGVGQSEIAVHSMVDFFLLLQLAGAGDELQGIKRGIMEMADAILINKADGENVKRAQLAKAEYKNALHLFPATPSGWEPQVDICSAIEKGRIGNVWKIIQDYVAHTRANGFFENKRLQQNRQIMLESINESLKERFYRNQEICDALPAIEADLMNEKMSSYVAAHKLLQLYFGEQEKDPLK